MALISCPECGKQVSSRAVSCPNCGCPIAADFGVSAQPAPQAAPQQNQQLEKVDREIVLAHLADIRALELSKYSLQKKMDKYAARYKLGHMKDMTALKIGMSDRIFDFLSAMLRLEDRHYMTPLQISNTLRQMGLSVPFVYVKEDGKSISLSNYLITKGTTPDNLLDLIDEDIKAHFPESETFDKDMNNVNASLAVAYMPNLIPAPYRNVYSIYHLYEYLSTSQESLTDALLHMDLDAIRQRLDTVIAGQCVTILQQAITNAQLSNIQDQFDTLIETAQSIQQDTAAAARYTQISAAHLETIKYLQFFRL